MKLAELKAPHDPSLLATNASALLHLEFCAQRIKLQLLPLLMVARLVAPMALEAAALQQMQRRRSRERSG